MSKNLYCFPLIKILFSQTCSQTKQFHAMSDRWVVTAEMPCGEGFWYALASSGKLVTSSIRKLIDMDEEREQMYRAYLPSMLQALTLHPLQSSLKASSYTICGGRILLQFPLCPLQCHVAAYTDSDPDFETSSNKFKGLHFLFILPKQ